MFLRLRELPAGSTQRECDWSRVRRLLLVRRRLVTALLAPQWKEFLARATLIVSHRAAEVKESGNECSIWLKNHALKFHLC